MIVMRFNLLIPNMEKSNYIISLGNSCSVAYQKQKLGIKEETYPFDWIRIESLTDIIDVLNSSFDEFANNLIKVSESDKFPIFMGEGTDKFPDPEKQSQSKSIIMKNRYNMKFYHDFDSTTNPISVEEKYKRRIHRFTELIKSNNNICFVRDELKPSKITTEVVLKFIDAIKKINDKVNFRLIIVLHQPKDNHELIINNINNIYVKIIIDKCEFGDWTRPNVEWPTIFLSSQ